MSFNICSFFCFDFVLQILISWPLEATVLYLREKYIHFDKPLPSEAYNMNTADIFDWLCGELESIDIIDAHEHLLPESEGCLSA
jgi:hypothetical protein